MTQDVETFISALKPRDFFRVAICADAIWEAIKLPRDERTRAKCLWLAKTMRGMGFQHARVRVGKTVHVGYVKRLMRAIVEDDGQLRLPF